MKIRKSLSVAAVFLFLLSLLMAPPAVAGAEEDLASRVAKQIDDFASSLYTSNAAEDAALTMALHGISQGGKALHAGEGHALTATLVNSRLLKTHLVEACIQLITYSQNLGQTSLRSVGGCHWGSRTHDSRGYAGEGELFAFSEKNTDSFNSCDTALEWIAGSTDVRCNLERLSGSGTSAIYEITVTVSDRFDFSTGTGSVPKDLLSIIGSFLFRPFDWDATWTFRLEVPVSCSHSTGNTHWTLNSAITGGNGKYRLDRAVMLRHDLPWVLEYTVTGDVSFALSPVLLLNSDYPFLLHNGRLGVYFTDWELVHNGDPEGTVNRMHWYGRRFDADFGTDNTHTYTYRYENTVAEDGSNMIFLTVYDRTAGKTVLNSKPMEKYYRVDNGIITQTQKSTNWLSGKDFRINCIGTQSYPVGNWNLELSVWENGQNNEAYSHCTDQTVAPTCTEGGYTEHTCTLCGAIFRDSETSAAGHSFGDWVVTEEPTYEKPGEQTRTCTDCGHEERIEVPKLEPVHGDVTCDGIINGKDLVTLRQHLAGWSVTAHPYGADTNGDGRINGKDLILLRQYLAGWDVSLG